MIDTKGLMNGDKCRIFFDDGKSATATFRNGVWQDKKNNVFGSSVVRYKLMKKSVRGKIEPLKRDEL